MVRGGAWGIWRLWVVGLMVLVTRAEADLFRFRDDQGVIHYTNAPSDPRYRRLSGWREPRSPGESRFPTHLVARFAGLIRVTAERYRVDRRLVEAVVVVESAGNPRAVSRKGAQGLMQLMPERAAQLGVRDPFDARENLEGGVQHLRDLLERFEGDVALALAAYNAGEEAVRAYGGVPPYPETQRYVAKVRALYNGRMEARHPVESAPQRIYRSEGPDGTLTYTNVPPDRPGSHNARNRE